MKAEVKLGSNVTLVIDEQKEMETLHKAIVLSNPPTKCTLCNGEVLRLDSNKDKEGNIYVNVACSCGAKVKLGQYKAGGYFWHRDFEKYVPKDQAPPPADDPGPTEGPKEEGVPF